MIVGTKLNSFEIDALILISIQIKSKSNLLKQDFNKEPDEFICEKVLIFPFSI